MAERIEIITRTERRRKYSEAEKAAILSQADREGVTVRAIAGRHGIAESLIYNWRAARRHALAIVSEPMQFIAYGVVPEAQDGACAPIVSAPARPVPPSPVSPSVAEELVRPFPGVRPGAIDIDLKSGVRLVVDSYVNEKALARVLRALGQVS